MKSIFSYKDLNLSQLEESTQKKLLSINYNNHFEKTDLIVSVMFGDLEKARYLLSEKNVDINEKCEDGDTALLYSCYYFGCHHNNYKVIKLLLDNKADLNIKGHHRKSPFYMICDTYLRADFENQKNKMNFMFAFKILLNYGANINIIDSQGNTILMLAVIRCRIDLIKILLNEKINIYVKNDYGENVFDKINKLEGTDAEKREIYNMLSKYKYNDAVFYSFEEHTDINIFFNYNKN